MPGVAAARGKSCRRRENFIQLCECPIVLPPEAFANFEIPLDSRELMDAERRLDVHHVELVSRVKSLVRLIAIRGISLPSIAADAVKALDPHLVRPIVVVGGHHAAFAGTDVLGDIKAENGHGGDAAHSQPTIARLDRVGCVLDHDEIAAPRDFHDFSNRAWAACHVDGDDRPGTLTYSFLDTGDIDVHRLAVDIDEDGSGPSMDDHV